MIEMHCLKNVVIFFQRITITLTITILLPLQIATTFLLQNKSYYLALYYILKDRNFPEVNSKHFTNKKPNIAIIT